MSTMAPSSATATGWYSGSSSTPVPSRIQHRAVVVLAQEDRVEAGGLGALAFLDGLLERPAALEWTQPKSHVALSRNHAESSSRTRCLVSMPKTFIVTNPISDVSTSGPKTPPMPSCVASSAPTIVGATNPARRLKLLPVAVAQARMRVGASSGVYTYSDVVLKLMPNVISQPAANSVGQLVWCSTATAKIPTSAPRMAMP